MSPRCSLVLRSCVPSALSLLLLSCGGAPAPAATPATEPSAGPGAREPAAVTNTAATSGEAPAPAAPAESAPSAPEVRAEGCPEQKDRSRTQLAAADVQELVTSNRSHLHAACWKPAIAKNPKGPDKVRVATELQVEPDGHVKDVKVVGGGDYAGFSSCLERELRLWCFPGAKQPSSLMFPMVFVKAEGEMMAVPRGSSQ